MSRNLILFTDIFPFSGGEPFLETEIWFLSSNFDNIYIFPLNGSGDIEIELPKNVLVRSRPVPFDLNLRKLVFSNLMLLLKWWMSEFIRSPHRWKYIAEAQWNFNRFVGLLSLAQGLAVENGAIFKSAILYSYWFNDWASVLAILKSKKIIDDFVVRAHLFDFEEEFNGRGYLPFRYVEIRAPGKIYPISSYALNYISQKWPGRISDLVLSRLGVRRVGNSPIPDADAKLVLVSCSSLSWYKRPIFLVETMTRFRENVDWHHFGSGPMEEEFLRAAKLLPPNVNLIYHGRVRNSEVLDFYHNNAVHAFINVSIYEGIPVSIMEAISFGIPVVGCNICGVPEIVSDATGLLLERDVTSSDAASEISVFIKDRGSNSEFRDGITSFWKMNFNAENNYSEFIERHLLN